MTNKLTILLVLIQISLLQETTMKDFLIQKPFYHLSEDEINLLLPRYHEKYNDFNSRLKAIALDRLGTPYDFKAIGDESGTEPKPFFRIDVTNCTAFVLTNMALASSRTFQEAKSFMVLLNYYPASENTNPVRYENRCHFTADRLLTSAYFQLITDQIADSGELNTIKLTLNRQADGSHFLPIDWEKEVEIFFIPKKYLTGKLLKKLPSLCGVGIIRTDLFLKGIIVAHEGIVLDGRDFVHASKDAQKVVIEDFLQYTRKRNKKTGKPVCDGIILYLMKEVDNK